MFKYGSSAHWFFSPSEWFKFYAVDGFFLNRRRENKVGCFTHQISLEVDVLSVGGLSWNNLLQIRFAHMVVGSHPSVIWGNHQELVASIYEDQKSKQAVEKDIENPLMERILCSTDIWSRTSVAKRYSR